jgi:hypothetical protein
MSTLPTESLLAAFKEFLQQLPVQQDDLEPLDNAEDLSTDFKGAKGTFFEPVAQESSGGHVALWQEPGLPQTAERPVVWLDGDGSPFAVCASSLSDFLAVLPYGTGFIRRILNANINHRQSPENFLPPNVLYLPEDEAEYLAKQAASAEAYSAYVQWLSETVGRLPLENPVEIISRAFSTHTNVEEWLDS